MINELAQHFWMLTTFATLVALTGAYCILVSRNLIRILIGLELFTKSVTLLLIVAGYVTRRMALAQSLVITLIVVEVVVIAIAAGIVIGAHGETDTLDTRNLSNLKG
jgi:NADH-quinone oxidoreductase subunit K